MRNSLKSFILFFTLLLTFAAAPVVLLYAGQAGAKPVPPRKPSSITQAAAEKYPGVPVSKPGTVVRSAPASITPSAVVSSPAPAIRQSPGAITPLKSPAGKVISANLVTKDPSVKQRTVAVTTNKSFEALLADLSFNRSQVATLSQKLSRNADFQVSSAKVGQQIILTEKIEGNKRKLIAMHIPHGGHMIKVYKNRAGIIEVEKERREQQATPVARSRYFFKSGIVQTNISQLGTRLNVPSAVTNKAIRVLNGKINTAQVTRGDKLDLFYEYTYNESGQQTGLRLLYLNLVHKGKTTEGFRYSVDGRDTGEFFDTAGNSFTKSMLASPLRGRHKISSGFGYRRHPILGRRILHSGVDFAGRNGEPVYAAGDGTIDKIGRFGGYGNYMRIKHDNTWSTAYAHMSGYARGMHRWKRVNKGELIGYVGSTGRSTGPHLHFELLQSGRAIDPLRAKLPVGSKKLMAKELYSFRQETNRVRTLINQAKNNQ